MISNLEIDELGLFATKSIKEGTRIIRYFGRLLDSWKGLCQEDAQASCCTRDEGGPFEVAL